MLSKKIFLIFITFLNVNCIDTNLRDELVKEISSDIVNDEIIDSNDAGNDAVFVDLTFDLTDITDQNDSSLNIDPIFLQNECSEFEQKCDKICLSVSSNAVSIRANSNQDIVLNIEDNYNELWQTSAPSLTQHYIIYPLIADKDYSIKIWGSNINDIVTETISCDFKLQQELEKIVINEVLLNPVDNDPGQEFIEIYNWGDLSLDINGWKITDEQAEDAINNAPPVEPNGFLLLVGDTFIINEELNEFSANIVKVEGLLGKYGLKNSGEKIYLRDSNNILISWFPYSRQNSIKGCSWERVLSYAPDCDYANWQENISGSSTPGEKNSVSQ